MDSALRRRRLDLRPTLIVALLAHAFALLGMRYFFSQAFDGGMLRMTASSNHITWIEIAPPSAFDAPNSATTVQKKLTQVPLQSFPNNPSMTRASVTKQLTKTVARNESPSATTGDTHDADGTDAKTSAAATPATGAVSSPASGSTAGTGGNSPANTLATIAAKLRSARSYPEHAQANHWEGRPIVTFRIAADGGIAELYLATSSGIPTLDTAALETVRRAAPLPYYPASITLPVDYRLQ